MLVWVLAKLNISACCGVTSRLTTATETGLPSASFWKFWPADSTCTFCSRVLVTPPCAAAPGGLPDTSTSTRMPGTAKPATPTISFTRMATARMPLGIRAARPAPPPLGANRLSTMGSPPRMGEITPRPTMSSFFWMAPSGRLPFQSPSRRSASRMRVPGAKSFAARISLLDLGAACVVTRPDKSRYSNRLAPAETIKAKARTEISL